MNLVQRMVAENLQSVTSQELAEAMGMPHEEFCQFVETNRENIEHTKEGHSPLQITSDGFIFDVQQAFGAVIFVEMSDEFYAFEGETPADKMKMDLKASFIKVLNTLLNAQERRTGKKRNLIQEFFEEQGIRVVDITDQVEPQQGE